MLKLIDFKFYPVRIYLHIGEDISESCNQFYDQVKETIYDDNWLRHDAAAHTNIVHRESNQHSILIAFKEIPTLRYIVHELTHATDMIYEHIGQRHTGDENHAYLTEFLAMEIETFINEYKTVQNDNL